MVRTHSRIYNGPNFLSSELLESRTILTRLRALYLGRWEGVGVETREQL